MTMTLTPPRARADARDESTTADPRWQAVIDRDRRWDGTFVFAVSSTHIYSRPSCPSRRPREDRVAFYETGDAARSAGYRACKRCHPDAAQPDATTVAVVRALVQLESRDEPITLDALADSSGVSRSHLQRQFTQMVGCSPHEWQTARRAERLRSPLRAGEPVSRAAFEAGFESLPSAYAASAQHLGMSPGAYRRGSAGETVFYTIVPCALGHALVAMTSRGVCRVILGDDAAALDAQLREEMPAASLVADDAAVREVAEAVVQAASGVAVTTPLPLDLRGTRFSSGCGANHAHSAAKTITCGTGQASGITGAVRAGSACSQSGGGDCAVIAYCAAMAHWADIAGVPQSRAVRKEQRGYATMPWA
jgi:AraC family transcriptional regulator of adaptative response/methylated-DNA-[protein]-cysteine methyltransferase